MRGSDRMHALYLHFTDAPLSDYARAENHSAALQITFIFYSAEICMISKAENRRAAATCAGSATDVQPTTLGSDELPRS